MVPVGYDHMNRKLLERLSNSSFQELDPKARRLALLDCRSYKDPRNSKACDELRDDFNQQNRLAKRSVRALKKLERGLDRLEADIKSTLKGMYSWDVISDRGGGAVKE
jgi:hypothetical protein